MENNTPRAATQSQWEDLPKRIQAQQYKPVATITYSYNDFQNVWSNLNTSNYSSGYTRESAFMQNFPWELSVDFNDLKNYLNIELEDGAPSTQQYSSVPITFQLQSYLGTGDAREYIDKQFGDGAITFSNYPAIDDIQITVQPFGQSVSRGGSRRSVGEDAYVFIRENNVSNLFSFSRNETSYQLTTFPINFTATPDFANGVVAFSNTYNIAPFDLSVGSYNATWRDLCEQVVQGVFPTIRLAGNWYTKSNTDTVQILEGRVFNRSGAGREGTAIDLTTLISFSPEGVNNMPNTYNMDCLATLRLHQNYALETIATKMVGSGSGGISDVQVNGVSVVNNGVANIGYATSSTGGVIKGSSTTGTGITSAGVLYASSVNYNAYNNANIYYFVSKGTLENVIEGKGLADQTDLANKQDKLTAGDGISITDGVISCTFANGNGISY